MSTVFKPDRQRGSALRAWRKDCNVTQQELAALIGVHPKTIQKYESGTKGIPLMLWFLMLRLEPDDALLAAAREMANTDRQAPRLGPYKVRRDRP